MFSPGAATEVGGIGGNPGGPAEPGPPPELGGLCPPPPPPPPPGPSPWPRLGGPWGAVGGGGCGRWGPDSELLAAATAAAAAAAWCSPGSIDCDDDHVQV